MLTAGKRRHPGRKDICQMNEIKKEKIDLFYYLSQFGRMLKRTWWLFIFLSVLAFGILSVKIHWFYTPRYAVSASFSVNSGGNACYSDYAASVTLDQLNATFPYILESGALKKLFVKTSASTHYPGPSQPLCWIPPIFSRSV